MWQCVDGRTGSIETREVRLAPVLLLAAVACGSRDRQGQREPPARATGSLAPPNGLDAAAATPSAAPDVVSTDAAVDDAFVRGPVQMPEPLAKLPLAGSIDDVRRVAPELIDAEVTDPRWPGLVFEADFLRESDGTPTEYVGASVAFRSDVAGRGRLEAAWGPGREAIGAGGRTLVVWFNPADRIRAVFEGWRVELRRYLPLAALLGDGVEVAVGPTPAALVAAFPVRGQTKGVAAELPPTEWDLAATGGSGFTVASTTRIGGQVASYTLRIAYEAYPPAREQILEAFRRKWGRGADVADGIRFVDGPIEVVASDSPGAAWYLRVTDRALQARLQR